jgi:hypothetical protein
MTSFDLDVCMGEMFIQRAFASHASGAFADDGRKPLPQEFKIADVLRILRAALPNYEGRNRDFSAGDE